MSGLSLSHYAALASVGPVMTEALEAAGWTADILPVHPARMAALVKRPPIVCLDPRDRLRIGDYESRRALPEDVLKLSGR